MGSRREETAVRYPDGVVRSMHDDRLAPYPPGWTAEATARFYGYPVGDPRGVTRAALRNFERALSELPPAQPDDDLLTRATREAARSMVDDLRAQLADDDA